MKSKTVASIMRHVASKVPSVNGEVLEGEQAKQAEADAAETKRARRAAKKEGHEEDIAGEEALGGGVNEESRLEQLYDEIAWPLGRKYGHPYDAFKLALTCVSILSLSPSILSYICHTHTPPIKLEGRTHSDFGAALLANRTPCLRYCRTPYSPPCSASCSARSHDD